ncbi:MAG: LysM peptidoglycan-binding domain-containing protein, partial [Bacteroidetes bacterium]|nr:LysM peptidoglycan-binding domain-containing protein [Bacteroidota bacterium]
DFKYLALQESALVPDAVSSSNAVGFWQFKDFTAKEMGLRVDEVVDERMNIASASLAAARYIKQCNHYFNNWVYALQSYQMGAGGVLRAVGDKDLGSRHMEITSETYWYVKKFLAHMVAFQNISSVKPSVMLTPISATGQSVADIARSHSVDADQLREFNKWLKTDVVPDDKTYTFLVPNGKTSENFGVLMVASAKPSGLTSGVGGEIEKLEINEIPAIRARAGDNAGKMAALGHISLNEFLSYNEIDITQPIKIGQVYFFDKKKKKASQELYRVKPGDDLWSVSQQFGVQQKYLRKYNNLDEKVALSPGNTLNLAHRGVTSINEGEVIVLNEQESFHWEESMDDPDGSRLGSASLSEEKVQPDQKSGIVDVTASAADQFHDVKPSDTLYSVARQYGVTIKDLMEWNDKRDFSISIGERLRIRNTR